MKDNAIRKIFREFYELSYKDSSQKFNQSFKDSVLSDYVILRQQDSGDYIHYLYNGNSIFIPIKWVEIFSFLNVYDGNKIFTEYNVLMSDDKVSKICYLMTYLVYCIDSLGSKSNGKEILDTIHAIKLIGTGEFRDWAEENFKLTLFPLECRSLDEIIKI